MLRRMSTIEILAATFALAAGVAIASAASAASDGSPPSLTLTLKDHRFSPTTLAIPAGSRVRVTLINRDAATEEFDSHDLRIEQLVTPMAKVSFNVGPLRPGQYSFEGEFHANTAQGKIIVAAGGR